MSLGRAGVERLEDPRGAEVFAQDGAEYFLLVLHIQRDQTLLLQAILTHNWIYAKAFPNSIVLSQACAIFLPFNKRLNKGQRREGTIQLGAACAWPARVAAINRRLCSRLLANTGLPKRLSAWFVAACSKCLSLRRKSTFVF